MNKFVYKHQQYHNPFKMNRRNFLKNGGLLMFGAAMAPGLLKANAPSSAEETTTAFGMNHFGVSENDLRKVLAVALEKGGDYADLFFEHTFNNSVSLQDGAVNQAGSNIDFGMGVRVLKGDQTGYAFVENVTMEDMLNAARTAARIADDGKGNSPAPFNATPVTNNFYAIQTPWDRIELASKMPYLQKLNDQIFAQDPRVVKVSAFLSDTTSHIFFCNSEGMMYYDYRPMVSLGAFCIMEQNGEKESGNANRSFRTGTEFLSDELVADLAKETVSSTARMFGAITPQGGELPVVMAAGGSGILLHEAIGHAFEADFNRKNTSIFSDKLGKTICNENINVVDDATIPNNRGSVNIDDEGVAGQKTYIVKNGVLNSYLHDRLSAAHYGIASTGNGRRESFREIPMPRMRATYMEGGNASEAEIVSSVKNGIYAEKFTNGQVQIGAGDFTFFVKLGYLIEDGKLTQPIKDINIIGNGPKALAAVTMVGNNPKIDNGTWTCGKNGQSCPVTCGMPTVLVSKLTVGGKG